MRPFYRRRGSLLKSFADQAAIAMENSRLFSETREALAHQEASAEVLAVINSSVADAAPIVRAHHGRLERVAVQAHGDVPVHDADDRIAAGRLPRRSDAGDVLGAALRATSFSRWPGRP